VLGWSTGGEIALALAVRHPGLARALILSGATAGSPASIQSSPEVDALLRSTKLGDELRLLTHYLFPPSASGAVSAYVRGLMAMPAEAVSRAIMRRQARAERVFAHSIEVYDGLPHVQTPVLVTNGTLDRLVPPANARLIATRLPHARLVLFAGAAHAMMFQDMRRFIRLMESFALSRS
jgi:pimeloyl-ACP methyl ester carboxylesterase